MPPFPTSRFQLERTNPLRAFVYREARLASRRSILEVGCGEGPVAAEMAGRTGREVLGLDLEPGPPCPGVFRVRGDARRLPFASGSLDAVACHFSLLWIKAPVPALWEVRRVLAPRGVLLVLAEPDLTRRAESPETGLGPLLSEAVRAGGGDPSAGAALPRWLVEAGFRPHLYETPPEPQIIRDPAELLHECDFAEALGLDASPVRAGIHQIYGRGETVQVTLPLTYGWAEQEGEEGRK